MGTDRCRRDDWHYVDASAASGKEIFTAVLRGRLWLNRPAPADTRPRGRRTRARIRWRRWASARWGAESLSGLFQQPGRGMRQERIITGAVGREAREAETHIHR